MPALLKRHGHWLLLALILLAGLALRFYRLGTLPPGLYRDEAFYALDALDVLAGARPLYFASNNGREPLFIYLLSLSLGALGRSPLAVRLPSAIIGALTPLAAYALGRALYTPRFGLLAAAVTALTFWPVALSRIGLRAGTLPIVLALALACAAAGWRRSPRHLGLIALGGALCGLTFYTYLAARFVPLALIAFLVFWYSARRSEFPTARELAVFAVPAALVALPLLVLGLRQPEILTGRVGQVSVLNPAVNGGNLAGTLLRHTAAALGMFIWRGDDIARHNLPGRPVFDPLLAAAFLAGAYLLVRQALARRLPAALLLLWVGSLLLPTILAEDTPHFLRAVGVLPAACLVAAAGLDWLWNPSAPRRAWRQAAVVAALAVSGAWTAYDYFGRYAAAPDTAYLFEAAVTRLAEQVRAALRAGTAVYVDRRFWDQFSSLRFLVGDAAPAVTWIDGVSPLPPPPPNAPVMAVLWPYEPVAPVLAGLPVGLVLQAEPGPLHRGDLEPAPYPLYALYTARPAVLAVGEQPSPLARFEGGLALLMCRVTSTPEGQQVELVWQAGPAPGRDWQVFVVALAGNSVLAQADGPLGGVWLPSSVWRAGELVAETRLLSLDSAAARGATLSVGLYDLATGARLPRVDAPSDAFEIPLTP